MSASVLRLGVLFPLALAGCNLVVQIFPSQQCPPRDLVVEIQPDAGDSPTAAEHHYHSGAGCTIIFDVRRYHLSVTFGPPSWDPIGGLDYELRVEPYRVPHDESEVPSGRLETGSLPPDGRLVVPTAVGETSVRLTVYVPDAQLGTIGEEIAVVHLD